MRDKSLQSMYNSWCSMIQRCTNPNLPDFKHWGGRGITVCERWRCIVPRGTGFKNFVTDMGMRPPGYTLDRINNDGNYEPGNCRWATRKEQRANSRGDIMPAVRAHAAKKRAQTHCKNGHEFTPENTYLHGGVRTCRICRASWDRYLYYDKKIPREQLMYPVRNSKWPKT